MEQLIAHLIGDYVLQTDYQAMNKKQNFYIALKHAIIYTLPFLFITTNIWSLLIICVSHAIIDHTNLLWNFRKYINSENLSNIIYQDEDWEGKEELKQPVPIQRLLLNMGFNCTRPVWLCVWIDIIGENSIHLLINYLALKLGGI